MDMRRLALDRATILWAKDMDALKEKAIADEDGRSAAANKPRTDEGLFTCIVCEAHYEVHHLPDPVTECPVCGYAEKYDSNWGSRKGGA